MCLALVAGLIFWFAQSPVADTQVTSTSPVLKDRHGALLNVRTVESGTWRMAVDIDDIDPAFIEALLFAVLSPARPRSLCSLFGNIGRARGR